MLRKALERHDFDCTQMALNAAKAGMAKGVSGFGENHPNSFQSLALPVANQKKMGVIAMKVFAQEQLNGQSAGGEADHLFAFTAGDGLRPRHAKTRVHRRKYQGREAFQPMPARRNAPHVGRTSGAHKASIDRFFSDHIDA